MSNSCHTLKVIYNQYIHEKYGVRVWGDKNKDRTQRIARRISDELGISYNLFVRVAVRLWDKWSKNQGHKYPYWNIVTSDRTFEWIGNLLKVGGLEDYTDVDNGEVSYYIELMYASDYIEAILSGDELPERDFDEPDITMIIRVAEALCARYGVRFISSDYDYIAQQVANR